MRCKFLTFLTLSIFLSAFASAIVINEFTVDPQTDWDESGSATSSDEWVELFNPTNETINITDWKLIMNDSSEEITNIGGEIEPFSYLVIFPEGTQNNDGQIILTDNLGNLIDSVTYGTWEDGNESDNAPDGNADDISNECLARMPNSADSNIDSEDFQKIKCTFGAENGVLLPNEQGLNVTIAGTVALEILPRWLEFGTLQQGSTDNPALNGPITFDGTGSTTDFQIEVTNVLGEPFASGLKLDGELAIGKLWTILMTDPTETTEPTLDIPEEFQVGQSTGTIVYTITGIPSP